MTRKKKQVRYGSTIVNSLLRKYNPTWKKYRWMAWTVYLVDGDTIDVAVVDEPDDLVGEQLPVVLTRQVRLRGLGAGS